MNELIKQKTVSGALVNAAASREIAEVQGAMQVAKMFPRDQQAAVDQIVAACKRKGLAETAQYSYAKGGQDITGPSIRLAETIARCWGNIHFGVRELESRDGQSVVEAYAIDLETNTRSSKTFSVSHTRHTKTTSYTLTDPREIYEMTANNGARRLRACLLALIPGDIVDIAIETCEATLKCGDEPLADRTKTMLAKFSEIGVSKSMIEAKIQRKVEAITSAQYAKLGKTYVAIKDGMTTVAKEFETDGSVKNEPVVVTDPSYAAGAKAREERLAQEAKTQAEAKYPVDAKTESGNV